MSHQPPNIDEWSFKPSDQVTPSNQGVLYDISVTWSIPGPDSILPGDSPDHFTVYFDGNLYKDDVRPTETQVDILSVPAASHNVQICCEWPATVEHTPDPPSCSIIIEVPIPPTPPPGPSDPPVPSLAVVSRAPRTLNQRNRIEISWAAPNLNEGDIYWGQHGQILNRHQSITPKSDQDYSGTYTTDIETIYSVAYQFHVQVKNSQASNTWRSSDIVVTAVDNFRSARMFLQASGLPADKPLSEVSAAGNTTSLREVMGFGHTIA